MPPDPPRAVRSAHVRERGSRLPARRARGWRRVEAIEGGGGKGAAGRHRYPRLPGPKWKNCRIGARNQHGHHGLQFGGQGPRLRYRSSESVAWSDSDIEAAIWRVNADGLVDSIGPGSSRCGEAAAVGPGSRLQAAPAAALARRRRRRAGRRLQSRCRHFIAAAMQLGFRHRISNSLRVHCTVRVTARPHDGVTRSQ